MQDISEDIRATLRLATRPQEMISRDCAVICVRALCALRLEERELSGTTVLLDHSECYQLAEPPRCPPRTECAGQRRSVVNQRYAIGWNDRLQLRNPRWITQLVWEAFSR